MKKSRKIKLSPIVVHDLDKLHKSTRSFVCRQLNELSHESGLLAEFDNQTGCYVSRKDEIIIHFDIPANDEIHVLNIETMTDDATNVIFLKSMLMLADEELRTTDNECRSSVVPFKRKGGTL